MCVYGEHNGVKFRVQAEKPLSMEAIKAIKKMVEFASNKVVIKIDNDGGERSIGWGSTYVKGQELPKSIHDEHD